MIDVVALGELLIDFAAKSTDASGYPTMTAGWIYWELFCWEVV